MAIDESMIKQYDDQLQSNDADSLRNCPTPIYDEAINDDLFNEFNLGDVNNIDFDFTNMDNMSPNGNNVIEGGGNNFQPIDNNGMAMTSQHTEFVAFQNVSQPSFNDMQSTSYSFINVDINLNTNINSPFSGDFLTEAPVLNTTEPVAPAPFAFLEDIKPIIDDNTIDTSSSDTMQLRNSNENSKEKCMSRNAILARQNRDKKKNELHNLYKKVKELEEENSNLKKNNNELSENYAIALSRNTYLEAVIQNIPQIVNMVDHMHKLPSTSTAPHTHPSTNMGKGPNPSKKN